ncbi:MAG: helix-turn-helix transcriptional regulator [Clostridia bacterium]|nr:helix-turn-helix transcriptional regulator [Clostridia bacterium]
MIYNKLNLKCIPKPIFAHVYSCPGYQLKLKKLTPNIEIAYIKEGQLKLEILGKEFVAKENSFIVLPHNYNFFIHAQKNEPHIHYTISAVMGEESSLCEALDEKGKEEIFVPLIIYETSKTKQLENLLFEAIREYQNADDVNKIKCGCLFARLLCELVNAVESSPKLFGTKPEIIDSRIKKYIEKNIHTKILLTDIADALGKNKNYLNQVFKKINNTSIISYVNSEKMKKLAVLIADNGYSVKEAANAVGITDVNYVSRIFKQKMGMSLSEYKSASVDYTYPLEQSTLFKKE